MSGTFVRAVIRRRTAETARGPLDVHRVLLNVRPLGPGGVYAPPTPFQWDTGSELSVMSEAVARRLGLPLDDGAEETGIRGVTGDIEDAWLVPRFVLFPGLDGFRFRIHFLIHKGSTDPLPLLGMRDTYRNFEVVSKANAVFFFLKRDHTGEAI